MNSSLDRMPFWCYLSIENDSIFTSWFLVYLLFLPVFLFVLYIGFNKWTASQSSASGGLSHSDVFSLNMAVMEMTGLMGSSFACYGFLRDKSDVLEMGGNVIIVTTTIGQILFHSLTCVERYLAVVHPVTYLRLKRGDGVTIRNISICFVWISSLFFCILSFLSSSSNVINRGVFQALSGLVASIAPMPLVVYCSSAVLCVLVRPKPGEGGGNRWQIDQSKRTTVYTMLAILGALLLRLIVQLLNCGVFILVKGDIDGCMLVLVNLWSALPSSLVLPLLFLHRAGKLPHII